MTVSPAAMADVYGARVLGVVFGSLFPVLVSNLVLPWWVLAALEALRSLR